MQKVVTFLEQHVQWVALGIGAVWLLYMVYGFVLTPPATTHVGNNQLSAGNVDTYIADHQVQTLQTAMQDTKSPPMEIPQYAQDFKNKMDYRNEPVPELFAGAFRKLPMASLKVTAEANSQGRFKFANLPDIQAIAPRFLDAVSGRMAALVPALDWRANAANPNPPPPQVVDKYFATLGYSLPMKPIVEAWNAVFSTIPAGLPIPPQVRMTQFLAVDVVREELGEDGVWGKPTPIKPLSITPAQPWPASGNRADELNYINWSSQHQADILTPAFYQKHAGDDWRIPGAAAAPPTGTATPAVEVPFDPANPPRRPLTPQERQAVMQYRQQQEAEQLRIRREANPRRRPPAPTGPKRGGEQFAPGDPARPESPLAQARGAGIFVPPDDGMMPEWRGAGPGPEWNPNAGGNPNPGAPGALNTPQGAFSPEQLAGGGDVMFWFHDDALEPGKTYRYKARVRLKNPLWGQRLLVQDRAMADRLALDSGWSEWSTAVTMPRDIHFYMAAAPFGLRNDAKIKIDIFKWHKGVTHQKTVQVSPGDLIVGADDEIAYDTGYTVVDIRELPKPGNDFSKRIEVLVAGPDGRITTISPDDVAGDEMYKRLRNEAAAAQTAAAATPATPRR